MAAFVPGGEGKVAMSRTVLLVCTDPQKLSLYERAVAPIADVVQVATTFPQAKTILRQEQPDVLVTELRLNEFNGIHLALWSRVRLPQLRSVIIGNSDPSLEADARALGLAYLKENGERAIVQATQEALVTEVPQRRWPRKRLPVALSAQVDGRSALVIEVGYGGFRVQTTDPLGVRAHDEFALHIPEFDIRANATQVWSAQRGEAGHRCGASLAEIDTLPGSRWRTFVDALPVESTEPHVGSHSRIDSVIPRPIPSAAN
jgi:CheY-like chemotaxis protein